MIFKWSVEQPVPETMPDVKELLTTFAVADVLGMLVYGDYVDKVKVLDPKKQS